VSFSPALAPQSHADVTVTDISVHPFSKITVRGLKVQARGQEPFITAPEVRAQLQSLEPPPRATCIVRNRTRSPTVNAGRNPDGSRNLTRCCRRREKKPSAARPSRPAKASKPPQIDVRKLTVSNATFRMIKNTPATVVIPWKWKT